MKKIVSCLLLSSAMLSACNGGSSSDNSSSISPGQVISTEQVRVSSTSMIPIVDGKSSAVQLIVNSSVNAQVKLIKASLDGKYLSSKQLDATACNIVPQGGSCSLVVSIPTKSGNALLELEFEDLQNRKFKAATILSYQETSTAKDGLYYYITNNRGIFSANTQGSYILPVVLAEDYKDLNITSTSPLAKASLSCAADSLKRGAHCNIVTQITSGNYIAKFNLEGTTKAGHKTKAIIPYTVEEDSGQGYIVAGTANVLINPADGNNSERVPLLNVGLGSTRINEFTSNKTEITVENQEDCINQPLEPSGSCNVSVNALSQLNGQGQVTVLYGENQQTEFGVSYIGIENVGLLLEDENVGALKDIDLGQQGTTNIRVTNNGKTPINEIAFSKLKHKNMEYVPSANKPCNTTGNQALQPTQECFLSIRYTPDAVDNGSFSVNAVGYYQNKDKQKVTYVSGAVTIEYSATDLIADLQSANIPETIIAANNFESKEIEVTVTNTGNRDTTLSAVRIPGAGYPITTAGLTLEDQGCRAGTLLQANGGHCSVRYKFGATAIASTATYNLEFDYDKKPSSATTLHNTMKVTAQSANQPVVHLNSVTLNATKMTTNPGNGLDSPFKYVNFNSNQLQVTYLYQNTGLQDAENFSLDVTLPIGFSVDPSTTCLYNGLSREALRANNGECKLVLAIDRNVANEFYKSNVPHSVSILDPKYRYEYAGTQIIGGKLDVNKVDVEFVPAIDASSNISSDGSGVYSVHSYVNSVFEPSLYPVVFEPNFGENGGYLLEGSPSCSVANEGGSCPVNFKMADYMPEYEYWLYVNGTLSDASKFVLPSTGFNHTDNDSEISFTVAENDPSIGNIYKTLKITNNTQQSMNVKLKSVEDGVIFVKEDTNTSYIYGRTNLQGGKSCADDIGMDNSLGINATCTLIFKVNDLSTVKQAAITVTINGEDKVLKLNMAEQNVLGGKFKNIYTSSGSRIFSGTGMNYTLANLSVQTPLIANNNENQSEKIVSELDGDGIIHVGGYVLTRNEYHDEYYYYIGKSLNNSIVKEFEVNQPPTSMQYHNGELYMGGKFGKIKDLTTSTEISNSNFADSDYEVLLAKYDTHKHLLTKVLEAYGMIETFKIKPGTNEVYLSGSFAEVRVPGGNKLELTEDYYSIIKYDMTTHQLSPVAYADKPIKEIEFIGDKMYCLGDMKIVSSDTNDIDNFNAVGKDDIYNFAKYFGGLGVYDLAATNANHWKLLMGLNNGGWSLTLRNNELIIGGVLVKARIDSSNTEIVPNAEDVYKSMVLKYNPQYDTAEILYYLGDDDMASLTTLLYYKSFI